MAGMNPELANAIIASAKRLGVDPLDIATAMSYETGGKMDPALWGGKGGNYLGLIQFGPEERKKYGVHEGQSAGDQVVAAENFLRDRGVKPGMGLPDIYSTINAGSPGRYNASDANNGGAPGTVMDKVTQQMGPHRVNAARLLGMDVGMIPQAAAQSPMGSVTSAPVAGAPNTAPAAAAPEDTGNAEFMAALQNIPKMLQTQQANQQFAPAPPVPNNLQARIAAIAAARQGIPT
jgi:hypothetical protein